MFLMVWSRALQILADQSRKGVMTIRSISHACGDMPVKLGLELFDKLVMPILLYGSAVWGCEIRDRIEAVQRKYCRTLLGVNSRTQNDIVLAECDRLLPLYPIYMVESGQCSQSLHERMLQQPQNTGKARKTHMGNSNQVSAPDIRFCLYLDTPGCR